jgi:hypothetical protein
VVLRDTPAGQRTLLDTLGGATSTKWTSRS